MAKMESTFFNMVATLLVVTFVSSSALAVVYEVTKEPKARAELEKKFKAIRAVVPEFDNNPFDEKSEVCPQPASCATVYPAKKDGRMVATAVESSSAQGFGGDIKLLVGFLPDGTIYNTALLAHKETPGLGDKMDERRSDFPKQFKGRDPASFRLTVKKDGGDVDGITAATVSSRAFCDAVSRAYYFQAHQDRPAGPASRPEEEASH